MAEKLQLVATLGDWNPGSPKSVYPRNVVGAGQDMQVLMCIRLAWIGQKSLKSQPGQTMRAGTLPEEAGGLVSIGSGSFRP